MPAAEVLRKNACWIGLGLDNIRVATKLTSITSNHNDEQPTDSDDESIGLLRRR